MCSGSQVGSYLRLIDFVYHSTLGVRVIKKKKKKIICWCPRQTEAVLEMSEAVRGGCRRIRRRVCSGRMSVSASNGSTGAWRFRNGSTGAVEMAQPVRARNGSTGGWLEMLEMAEAVRGGLLEHSTACVFGEDVGFGGVFPRSVSPSTLAKCTPSTSQCIAFRLNIFYDGLQEDSTACVFGEDVGFGGVFRASVDLQVSSSSDVLLSSLELSDTHIYVP